MADVDMEPERRSERANKAKAPVKLGHSPAKPTKDTDSDEPSATVRGGDGDGDGGDGPRPWRGAAAKLGSDAPTAATGCDMCLLVDGTKKKISNGCGKWRGDGSSHGFCTGLCAHKAVRLGYVLADDLVYDHGSKRGGDDGIAIADWVANCKEFNRNAWQFDPAAVDAKELLAVAKKFYGPGCSEFAFPGAYVKLPDGWTELDIGPVLSVRDVIKYDENRSSDAYRSGLYFSLSNVDLPLSGNLNVKTLTRLAKARFAERECCSGFDGPCGLCLFEQYRVGPWGEVFTQTAHFHIDSCDAGDDNHRFAEGEVNAGRLNPAQIFEVTEDGLRRAWSPCIICHVLKTAHYGDSSARAGDRALKPSRPATPSFGLGAGGPAPKESADVAAAPKAVQPRPEAPAEELEKKVPRTPRALATHWSDQAVVARAALAKAEGLFEQAAKDVEGATDKAAGALVTLLCRLQKEVKDAKTLVADAEEKAREAHAAAKEAAEARKQRRAEHPAPVKPVVKVTLKIGGEKVRAHAFENPDPDDGEEGRGPVAAVGKFQPKKKKAKKAAPAPPVPAPPAAPAVPAPAAPVAPVGAALSMTPADAEVAMAFVDVGAKSVVHAMGGFYGLVLGAAARRGARAVGYAFFAHTPEAVAQQDAAVRRAEPSGRASVVAYEGTFADATCVFVNLSSERMPTVMDALAEARVRGASIVTNVAVPGWSYDDIQTCAGGGSLYAYRGNAPPVDDAASDAPRRDSV